jgi:HSP20 family molecular chaperone IbpA/sporulation protein YlmC with PRC-barrel domain
MEEVMTVGYLSPIGHPLMCGPEAVAASLIDIRRQGNDTLADLLLSGRGGAVGSKGLRLPAIDIDQTDEQMVISAELPGVKKEDVNLTLKDGTLTIHAEERNSRTDEHRGYTERAYGAFERRIAMPAYVDANACSADFENGILRVILPVRAGTRSGRRRIALGTTSKSSAGRENSSATPGHYKLILAKRVENTPVFSEAGERIGHVEDLSIDRQSGQVVYAIVSFGGFLGIGKRFHPVPWSVLKYDPEKGGYVVPLDKAALENAPHYEASELRELGGNAHNHYFKNIGDYYGRYGWLPM